MPKILPKNAVARAVNTKPLWKGPEVDGVTFSLLSRFLACRERFRVHAILGLHSSPSFSAPLEYGLMWHVCEEALASAPGDHVPPKPKKKPHEQYLWEVRLADYGKNLMRKFPMEQDKVVHWCSIASALFPKYVEYWTGHADEAARTPLLQEQTFSVPYKLSSGRVVKLRGKWDQVDLLDAHKDGGHSYPTGIWLKENKTKGSVDQGKLTRQLKWDLQTMLYLVALKEGRLGYGEQGEINLGSEPVLGVRYNVVRRPAHKGTDSMLKKLEEDCRNRRGGEWFLRLKVPVTQRDIDRFRKESLDQILETLCSWYDVLQEPKCQDARFQIGQIMPVSFRLPYGVYNPVAEGGFGEVDDFIDTGSTLGLRRAATLFPELEGA